MMDDLTTPAAVVAGTIVYSLFNEIIDSPSIGSFHKNIDGAL
jgi:hypothetical protein